MEEQYRSMSRAAEIEIDHSVSSKTFEVRNYLVLTVSFCLDAHAGFDPNLDPNLYLTYVTTLAFFRSEAR